MATRSGPLEIFYAEDNKTERLLFRLALNDIPIKINLSTSENGEEAMTLLSSSGPYMPDLILLDLKMPYKDGIECLEEIRLNKKFDRTPVLIYTTYEQPEYIQKAYELKANLYVQKPFDINMQAVMLRGLLTRPIQAFFPQPSMENFVLAFMAA
jgi:CheY-like chemotaxis protein